MNSSSPNVAPARLPRSVAKVLADHVTLEIEAIDRMYLNVYVPQLQRERGVASFFRFHRGHRFASSVLMDPLPSPVANQLKLTGSGFGDATKVLFNNAEITPISRAATSIEIELPTGNQGDRRKVVLMNPGGDRSDEREYIYP